MLLCIRLRLNHSFSYCHNLCCIDVKHETPLVQILLLTRSIPLSRTVIIRIPRYVPQVYPIRRMHVSVYCEFWWMSLGVRVLPYWNRPKLLKWLSKGSKIIIRHTFFCRRHFFGHLFQSVRRPASAGAGRETLSSSGHTSFHSKWL